MICMWEIGKTGIDCNPEGQTGKCYAFRSAYFRRERLRKTLVYCFKMISLSIPLAQQEWLVVPNLTAT